MKNNHNVSLHGVSKIYSLYFSHIQYVTLAQRLGNGGNDRNELRNYTKDLFRLDQFIERMLVMNFYVSSVMKFSHPDNNKMTKGAVSFQRVIFRTNPDVCITWSCDHAPFTTWYPSDRRSTGVEMRHWLFISVWGEPQFKQELENTTKQSKSIQ